MRYALVRHIIAFVFSLSSSLWIVPVIYSAARRNKILDVPDGALKKHLAPVPYFGGIAVYIAFVIGLLPVFPSQNRVLWLILGSFLLLILGAVDDLRGLSPSKKILGQIFVVSCFLECGFVLKTVFFSHKICVAISGLWMLTVINAFNLIDVMDGLATVVAIISTMAFVLCALLVGNFEATLLLMALLGALLGFFYYNCPPAKIYLGDAGAYFIGGMMAAVPLLLSWSEFGSHGFLAPGIVLGVPIAEVVTLVAVRTWRGIPAYMGSAHHFSIYLRNKGWASWAVLGLASGATFILSVIAILLFLGLIDFLVALAVLVCAFTFWCWLIFF